MEEKPVEYYMANCLDNILEAPCSDRNHYQRSKDIVAAFSKVTRTLQHDALITLAEEAKAGKYAGESANV